MRRPLPTGGVTLFLSDIERSTRPGSSTSWRCRVLSRPAPPRINAHPGWTCRVSRRVETRPAARCRPTCRRPHAPTRAPRPPRCRTSPRRRPGHCPRGARRGPRPAAPQDRRPARGRHRPVVPLTRGGHRVDLLAMTAEQIAKHLPTHQATPISLGWCPAKVVSAVARCSRRTARASPGHGPGRREPRRLPQVQQAPGFRPMYSFSPSHLDVVGYPEVARADTSGENHGHPRLWLPPLILRAAVRAPARTTRDPVARTTSG